MNIKQILLISAACLLASCADFPEKYENIIEDQKIRPFGIELEPAEAAPGDTVHVTLHMYDAGKNYELDWELALDYSISNYGQLGNGSSILDLDSMRLDQADNNLLEFDFIIPTGSQNPLLKSSMIPDILVESGELSSKEKALFENFGIKIGEKGLMTRDLVEVLDTVQSLPGEMAPFIDGFVSLVELRAKVKAPNYKLDVTKKLTIRYSNRLTASGTISNVNKNPRLASIGIITVHKKDVEDAEEIKNSESDTLWFSGNSSGSPVKLGTVVDTFIIKDKKSYFLIADTAGIAQQYRSPEGLIHKEQLFFEWFYTNVDASTKNWEDMIELKGDNLSLPVVHLKIPKDKNMHNFYLRCVALDWRPEWALLNSAGFGYLEAAGYFMYK